MLSSIQLALNLFEKMRIGPKEGFTYDNLCGNYLSAEDAVFKALGVE